MYNHVFTLHYVCVCLFLKVVCMALHAIAILSTSRACQDIPPDLLTPPSRETTPTKVTPNSSKRPSSPTSTKPPEGQKVMCLTPCPGNKYFRLFIVELLKMFDCNNRALLDRKGSFIIRCGNSLRTRFLQSHTYAHPHTYTRSHTHTHTHTLSHSHTYAHPHSYTLTHTHPHTLTHAHTHTHMQAAVYVCGCTCSVLYSG